MEWFILIILTVCLISVFVLSFILRANIVRNRKMIKTMYTKYELIMNSMVHKIDVPTTQNVNFANKFKVASDSTWEKLTNAVNEKI